MATAARRRAVVLVCGALAIATVEAQTSRQRITEIDVERLNLVEPDGQLVMVLANRGVRPRGEQATATPDWKAAIDTQLRGTAAQRVFVGSENENATLRRRDRDGRDRIRLAVDPNGAAAAQSTFSTTPAGLAYEVSGSGEPVVLIHAFSVDRRMWTPQIAALEGRFRVVRYDLRGHGQSAAPATSYAPHEDLRSVMDALGIERATLIGLSAGATLAIDFAIAHPARVSRLVLASPGLNGHVPSPPLTWTRPVFEAAGKGDAEGAARLWAETPIMALRSDPTAAATVRGLVMSNVKLWTYRTNPAQPLAPPAIGRLGEIAAPTLVILGGQDLPHIAEISGVLTKGIRGARLVTIPGAGHMVNLDARDAFNRAVEEFLQRR